MSGENKVENVVVIGGGISALTAAMYTARANLRPLILAGQNTGGQLMLTSDVENFPGFRDGITGPGLVEETRKQATRFGARLLFENATRFDREGDVYVVESSSGKKHRARTVIIATGADARMLGLESEKQYLSKGVSTCATCDGFFFRGKNVAVIGGGDSACEESLFLTKHVNKVTIIHRRGRMRASKIMQQRVAENPKIEILWDSVVDDVVGDGKKVTGLKVKNVKSGKVQDFAVEGMFLSIGHIPNTGIFRGKLDLDEQGFLRADRFTHTSLEGVFAAGDVQDSRFRQAVTAAGSGCMAAMEAERWLEEKGKA